MTAALLLFLLAYALTALPAIRRAEARVRVTWWHLGFPFSGLAGWVVLSGLKIGSTASASNFVVEMFWTAVVSLLSAWAFWACSFLPPRYTRLVCNGLTFLPLLTALILRLTMPTMPE